MLRVQLDAQWRRQNSWLHWEVMVLLIHFPSLSFLSVFLFPAKQPQLLSCVTSDALTVQ